MQTFENMPGLLALAFMRYLPAAALPSLSPLHWAPPSVRIAIVLALCWLTALAAPQNVAIPTGLGVLEWVVAGFGELAIGIVFGMAFALPMASLHTAGWLVDVQAGVGAATLFNPALQGDSQSLFGTAITLLVTTLFFSLGLHLDLYRGLVVSTQLLPLGEMGLRLDPESALVAIGSSFLLGFALVAPVVLGLFVVDVGVCYATRSMPQANVYFLVLPLKVLVTMLLLASSLKVIPELVLRLFKDSYSNASSVLGI